MMELKAELEDMIIVIDLENVRNDVLYFPHEQFQTFLEEEGLVFSDKSNTDLIDHLKRQNWEVIWSFLPTLIIS